MKNDMSRRLSRIKARFALIILVTADAAAIFLAVITALLLRFDTLPWSEISDHYVRPHLWSLPIATVLYILAFSRFRLYKCAWRFASLEIVWGIVLANLMGLAGLVAVQFILDGRTYPRSVIIILWTTSVVLTGGVRIFLRLLSMTQHHGGSCFQTIRRNIPLKRVLIIGAGANGARVLRSMREDPSMHYEIIGFLDDDPNKKGMYIGNVQVLGPLNTLKQVLTDFEVDEVVVSLPQIGEQRLREYVMECRKQKLPVKIVPQVRDVLSGRVPLQLVDFDVEDLLRRTPASTDLTKIGTYITGKRILITGAGGSIGSELCRQIIVLNPASLVLVGHGENSIHQIHMELQSKYPKVADRIHYAIASVAHQPRVEQVFKLYRPQIVFHAAAHKHVPMMETNEHEAVRNNVIGTYNVAQTCGRFEVERIVLISTDKAADPCCVMGTTKRMCEEILRSSASIWPKTCYVTVRFGNVLGSRGSVVSIFRDQIQHGKSVTVTHPEMTRYFMTIPEAVRLVLQAGAVGSTGELYLLDMGKPIKVVDLAKDMIRLSGYEPDVDVKIEFTGIRPGEKLHERLTSDMEQIKPTQWDRLSLVNRPEHMSAQEVLDAVEQLKHATNYASASDIRRLLAEFVPNCHKQLQVTVQSSHPHDSLDLRERQNAQAI